MHAYKPGSFGCTPKPQQKADTVHMYMTQQLHDTNTMACTTQCKQHDLTLSLKFTMKTCVEFPKGIGPTQFYVACHNIFHTIYQSKIHTDRYQTSSVTPYHGHEIKRMSKQTHRADLY